MIIRIDENTTVIQMDNHVAVTRPTVFGGVATHIFTTDYSAEAIAAWLHARLNRLPNLMAQEAFPTMEAEDREFLMSGITPAHWNKMFPKENV